MRVEDEVSRRAGRFGEVVRLSSVHVQSSLSAKRLSTYVAEASPGRMDGDGRDELCARQHWCLRPSTFSFATGGKSLRGSLPLPPWPDDVAAVASGLVLTLAPLSHAKSPTLVSLSLN